MFCFGPVDDEAISQVNCDLQLQNHLQPINAHIDQYYISEKSLFFVLIIVFLLLNSALTPVKHQPIWGWNVINLNYCCHHSLTFSGKPYLSPRTETVIGIGACLTFLTTGLQSSPVVTVFHKGSFFLSFFLSFSVTNFRAPDWSA